MLEILHYPFMQRALLAALMVGLAAPTVGVYLIQRRLSLIGDGIGHVALAGVAIGVLMHTQETWTALLSAVAAGVFIEWMRQRRAAAGDVALAVLFYGGIALGVVLLSKSQAGTSNMMSFLFGSIMTTTGADIIAFGILAIVMMTTMTLLRPRLFAVANDEEYARASGLKVMHYNLLLSVLTATTVVLSMRVIGLLLISALMILPNAAAHLFARSFASSIRWAMGIGVFSAVGGVCASYGVSTPPGGTIVLLAVTIFVVFSLLRSRWAAPLLAKIGIKGLPSASRRAVMAGDH